MEPVLAILKPTSFKLAFPHEPGALYRMCRSSAVVTLHYLLRVLGPGYLLQQNGVVQVAVDNLTCTNGENLRDTPQLGTRLMEAGVLEAVGILLTYLVRASNAKTLASRNLLSPS